MWPTNLRAMVCLNSCRNSSSRLPVGNGKRPAATYCFLNSGASGRGNARWKRALGLLTSAGTGRGVVGDRMPKTCMRSSLRSAESSSRDWGTVMPTMSSARGSSVMLLARSRIRTSLGVDPIKHAFDGKPTVRCLQFAGSQAHTRLSRTQRPRIVIMRKAWQTATITARHLQSRLSISL